MERTRRWFLVLQILSGPLCTGAEGTFRGPLLALGSNPGQDGLQLLGYPGLLARHCTLMAHPSGEVELIPVAGAVLRLAGHHPEDWSSILPLSRAVFIDEGCHVHLGDSESEATFVFRRSFFFEDPVSAKVPPAFPRQAMPTFFGSLGLVLAFLVFSLSLPLVISATDLHPPDRRPGLEVQNRQRRLIDTGLLPSPDPLAFALRSLGREGMNRPVTDRDVQRFRAELDLVLSDPSFFERVADSRLAYRDLRRWLEDAELPEVFAALPLARPVRHDPDGFLPNRLPVRPSATARQLRTALRDLPTGVVARHIAASCFLERNYPRDTDYSAWAEDLCPRLDLPAVSALIPRP